ncbi:hypothetical protein AVEN_141465-1 [Araneus ventricosus]|uniref:Uncharacterized protein n=1 Tax=Araneus ventricosus TaxID=182803 RepID=A0A4Y2QX57_ARAVE|nr:hypothetical protein AVEN_141465-1 [Araneus ventricosus]
MLMHLSHRFISTQFQLHKILWVALSSTVGLRVERCHHLIVIVRLKLLGQHEGHFEPRSYNWDYVWAVTISPSFHTTPASPSIPVDSVPMGGSVVDTAPAGGCLYTAYHLTCDRFLTRRVDSGIGFRTQYPQAPKPRPYHLDTEAQETNSICRIKAISCCKRHRKHRNLINS